MKGLLIASVLVLILVLAWAITAITLINTHPKVADAMNDILTGAVMWWYGRTG